MARSKKDKKDNAWRINRKKQTTSDGDSRNSRPKNKHKRRSHKKYRGQGRG